MRYLIASAEHMNFFNFFGICRRIALFKRLLPFYSLDEWRLAIDRQILEKIHWRFKNQKESTAKLMKHLRYRFRFYFKLHRLICEAETKTLV